MTAWNTISTPAKFNITTGVVSIMFGVFCGITTAGATIDRLIHYEFGTIDILFCVVPLMFVGIGIYLIKLESQSNNNRR